MHPYLRFQLRDPQVLRSNHSPLAARLVRLLLNTRQLLPVDATADQHRRLRRLASLT